MPRWISRDEALASIRAERGDAPCLMCAIRDRRAGDVHVVHEDDAQLVFLPRYVRRWGSAMVMPKKHVTTFAAIDDATMQETNRLAVAVARTAEALFAPRRCYVASLGSSAGELTQSSTHLHVHVIPLLERDDKPTDIFSWSSGVLVAAPEEWRELVARYRAAFR